MTVFGFILALNLVAAPAFDVQTLGGESTTGTITSLDETKLTLEAAAGVKEFPLRDLLAAAGKSAAKPPAATSGVQVELIDGSHLAATDFQATKGSATVTLSADKSLVVPTRSIRWVRFIDPAEKSEKLDKDWREILAGNAAGDLLVVRKKGAVDSTEGVVGDVSAESIAFTLDGDTINVKRPKVEGIVFAQAGGQELPESVCTVVDNVGARLTAKSLKLENDAILVTTPAGLQTSLPLGSVTQLDFSGGKIAFLSDLEPESFQYAPYFAPTQALPALADFYRLRRDVGLEKNPLRLDGRAYRKGIALHSRSTVVYRLPGKFRTFKAVVGIDDEARDGGGDVAVEIRGDGKSLWKESVRGTEAARVLELDIAGVKRLAIVADYGAGQDVADHLDLCDAKVTK